MLVDVLKRYLLIVWNFFFGQVASESIKDSPPCPNDQLTGSTNIVPPTEVDDDVEIVNEDEVSEEIFDDEDEEDEEEGDEDEELIAPIKQEDKIIINDVPAKPEVKVPEVPRIKDNVEINKHELPKVNDVETKENEKPKCNETEKKDVDVKKVDTPKLKPEFEFIESEASHDASRKDKDKLKSEFEIIEKEATVNVVPEKDPVKLISEEKELPKGVLEKNDSPKLPPKSTTTHVTFKEDVEKPPTDEKKQDVIRVPPKSEDHPKRIGAESIVGSVAGRPAGTTVQPDIDGKTSQHENNANFVVLEKGETAATVKVDGLKKTDDPIDSFLLGEQSHSSRLMPQSESIQDQQLDYSDSGEELSDDDIEIDYEDDEDEEDDEEVEEVKPLPPVARSVYKKND